ncbi:MAG: DoxX protein [Alphaproteobacteria bacterium CG_4_9_14_3_um_filter_47_13]|nr:MAG: DoxX protein [Alphaproteobacteria bacterium CG_4_9_14_3_um_filter_47_13]
MKTALKIITALFGLFWLVFGLNNFLHFFSIPEPSQAGTDFMQALENTGYVLPLVYGVQVIAGLMLLIRRFVPLALLLLAPIVANILLYDLFLNPSGLVIGCVIGVLYVAVLFDHKHKFIPLLKP